MLGSGLRAPSSPALSPALQAEKLQRGSNILPEVLLPLFVFSFTPQALDRVFT